MIVYILCPARRVTGGVELTHQLCCALNELTNIKALMWYMDIDDTTPETVVMNEPAPADYSIYNTSCATSFFDIDRNENVVVFPEGLTVDMELIDHAKKVLWWMSVDNYTSLPEKMSLDYLKQNVCLHLYQSYYAMDFANRSMPGAKGMILSDYISEDHGKYINPAELRKNLAIYNPKKGFEEIEPLIRKASWLEWVPLQGMNREQMILMMQMAKIYVDFGNHPGKDRIPREAAANGCCVITNKQGAAAFDQDVPIPERYKFDDPCVMLDDIDALMHEISDNFPEHQAKFVSYREMIKGEKKLFDEAVCRFADELERLKYTANS